MDFHDAPDQAAFRAKARAWLDANTELLPEDATTPARPWRGEPGETGEQTLRRAQAWQLRKADAGWACLTWPVEYGGRAASAIQEAIWGQEEARYRVPPNLFVVGQGMLGPTLMTHGTVTQKARYLPPMLRGEELWCQLFSEPGAGSDIAGLSTRAVRDGDAWVVNGQKVWASGVDHAKRGMILTRTDPQAAKHAGITYFVVEMASPGIEIRPIRMINGESDFFEIFFNDVRIPDENRVGAVNEGWRGAITTLMNERAAIGGAAVRAGLVRDLMRVARESDRNGRSAMADPAVRQRIADFYIRMKGLECTRYRTLTALARGQTPGPESSISKLVGANLRQQMASFALEVEGSAGVSLEPEWTPLEAAFQIAYVSSPASRIAGGTDEILRNVVAERILGLPGEIRVDKGLPFKDIPTGSNG